MNQIFDKIAKDFGGEIIKLGPTESDIKSQCVIKNFFDGKFHYTKVFVGDEAISKAKKEFEILTMFEQIELENIIFPKLVVSYEEEDFFYYTMEDIGGVSVDFKRLSVQQISHFYSLYRKEFDILEELTDGISLSIKKFNGPDNLKNYYQGKVEEYVDKGFDTVSSFLDVSKNEILDKLLEFDFSKFEKEYCFGRVWTGHVFDLGNSKYGFIDFDNVGYKIKGFELIELMRSNLLLNVELYDTFEEYDNKFNEWLNYISKYITDKNTLKFGLYLKFIGTIFMDYAYLMKSNISNETLKKGILWNLELFKKL